MNLLVPVGPCAALIEIVFKAEREEVEAIVGLRLVALFPEISILWAS